MMYAHELKKRESESSPRTSVARKNGRLHPATCWGRWLGSYFVKKAVGGGYLSRVSGSKPASEPHVWSGLAGVCSWSLRSKAGRQRSSSGEQGSEAAGEGGMWERWEGKSGVQLRGATQTVP